MRLHSCGSLQLNSFRLIAQLESMIEVNLDCRLENLRYHRKVNCLNCSFPLFTVFPTSLSFSHYSH